MLLPVLVAAAVLTSADLPPLPLPTQADLPPRAELVDVFTPAYPDARTIIPFTIGI